LPLNPRIRKGLDRARDLPAWSSLSPAQARLALAAQVSAFRITAPPVASVDRVITVDGRDIPTRLYTPPGEGPFPLLVYFHGGGFVLGSIDTHDTTCRFLCAGAAAMVMSVGYRLAPEHRFPAGLQDCMAALQWSAAHAEELGVDPGRMAVGGDSGGGNLAAVTAMCARDAGGPPLRAQLLIYPVTDHVNLERSSYVECAEGFGLTRADMEWFWAHYLGDDSQTDNPLVAPLKAKDLSGLPPAFIVTAEYDVLRDEGESFAEKLSAAGTPTRLVRCQGMNHGFWILASILDEATESVQQACAWLRERLSKTNS